MKADIVVLLQMVHENACALDFDKFNEADERTLVHDVKGLNKYFNRKTGKIDDCFLPICHV